MQISKYLQLNTKFEVSSIAHQNSIDLSKAERLIAICKEKGYDHYINPSGGKELYQKDIFKKEGISLSFIENELLPYRQFGNQFIKGLSIIDVLMFNTPEETKKLMNRYSLE